MAIFYDNDDVGYWITTCALVWGACCCFNWFWLTEWLSVWAVVRISNPSVLQFQHRIFSHAKPMILCICIYFHSLHTICNTRKACDSVWSLAQHRPVISIQLQIVSYVMVDYIFIFIFFWGGGMAFLSMLNVKCQIVCFISLSDAKIRDLSACVYSTKPSVCHAVADDLRHAKKNFNPLSYFKI